IIMAIRTFPIRVAGNSGPLPNEITWDEVVKRSGYPTKVQEFTTTTKRLRRVGLFDFELVNNAAMINRPTHIALHGCDYLAYPNKGIRSYEELLPETKIFIEGLENRLNIPLSLIGTGPANEELVDRR
ncbi:MAG: adenylosuccinate synthetase, partial [Nitrospiraceae bacterium]